LQNFLLQNPHCGLLIKLSVFVCVLILDLDWLFDWLFDWLCDWLFDWLLDWLFDWLFDWLCVRIFSESDILVWYFLL
jgi:hypothetical protein